MPPILAAQSIQGRDLLIQVARRLFLERGYAHVSIQQIAEEASMTKGAPYYYFANKGELFLTVSLQVIDEVKELMDRSIASEGTFQERLERLLVNLVHTLAGDLSQWYSDLIRLDDMKEIGNKLESSYGAHDLVDIFCHEFQRAFEAGEFDRVAPEVAARAYFLFLKACIDECSHYAIRHPGREFDMESHVHDMLDIYFNGISSKEKS